MHKLGLRLVGNWVSESADLWQGVPTQMVGLRVFINGNSEYECRPMGRGIAPHIAQSFANIWRAGDAFRANYGCLLCVCTEATDICLVRMPPNG
jgi:hypothetical protein